MSVSGDWRVIFSMEPIVSFSKHLHFRARRAVWFERLDWSEGETDFDACVLYPARLFVIDIADGQIGAILF